MQEYNNLMINSELMIDSGNDISLYFSSEKLYYFSDERGETCQLGQSISRK